VLPRPAFDLVAIPIGSSIAIRPAAVAFLKPLLILALELAVEDDAPNLRALVAEPFVFPNVGAIELDVVRQLTRPADAGVVGLLPRIVAVAAMGFQEVVAVCGQRQDALAVVERDEPHQPLVSQVTEVRLADISGLVAPIAQIAFGHHPKRADSRKRPAVVAVEFVPTIAIHHDLPLQSARQFETMEEDISRIVISFASLPVAVTQVATVARIIWFTVEFRLMTLLYPRHLDIADVIAAVTGIEVEHGMLSSRADTIASSETMKEIMRSRHIGGNSRSDGVGSCQVERVLGDRPSHRGRGALRSAPSALVNAPTAEASATHFQIDSRLTTMASSSQRGIAMTPPRLMEQVRAEIRARHYSRRTEDAYVHWIRRFIVFHGRRHPRELGAPEVSAFLVWLAVEQHVSAVANGCSAP
jgi:hypothetical protein